MFRSFNRALILSALAVVGSMAMCPVQAEDTKVTEVATALPGLPINSDPAFQKAVDFIRESNVARQKQQRRDNLRPAIQEKVVRARDTNHTYIMGGSAAIPM